MSGSTTRVCMDYEQYIHQHTISPKQSRNEGAKTVLCAHSNMAFL